MIRIIYYVWYSEDDFFGGDGDGDGDCDGDGGATNPKFSNIKYINSASKGFSRIFVSIGEPSIV